MKRVIYSFILLLFATQGCGGPNLVLYKPDVDQAQTQADKRECKEKADFCTGGGPMIGSRRSELDRNYEDCMEAKGYKWVDAEKVPK